jgi:hypothetical protein
MGHRMVLGYGNGLTIFLTDHVQRQQAESPLHDVATNFQFVEPPSLSPRPPQTQRGPASPPISRTKVAVGRGDGGVGLIQSSSGNAIRPKHLRTGAGEALLR